MIEITSLTCNDAKLGNLTCHQDNRGYFTETFRKSWTDNFNHDEFIFDFFSYNEKEGTLRGMHAQKLNTPQSKLVTVLTGKILDIIVDARTNSSTFGKFDVVEISARSPKILYVPVGFYHGFLTLENNTVVHYKSNNYHNANDEIAFSFNDQDLNLPWDIKNISTISNRDQNHPSWRNCYKFTI